MFVQDLVSVVVWNTERLDQGIVHAVQDALLFSGGPAVGNMDMGNRYGKLPSRPRRRPNIPSSPLS